MAHEAKKYVRNYVLDVPNDDLKRQAFISCGTSTMKNASGQYAAKRRPISNQSPRFLNLNRPTAKSTRQQIPRNRLTCVAGSIPVSKKEEPRKVRIGKSGKGDCK